MKRNKILSIVAVTVVILLGTTYIVFARSNKNPGVLPPNSRVQGLTYGEWSAKWWQYVLSIPEDENPLAGATGTNCIYQQIGNVGLIAFDPLSETTITCEVPTGMVLFLDILSAECSTVEEDPFYGGNEEELRACASRFTFTGLQASIDGSNLQNLDEYIHTSPVFDFTLPEENILYTDELVGQSVSKGAHLMLAPLSSGKHTVYLSATIPELEFTVNMNIDLIVTK